MKPRATTILVACILASVTTANADEFFLGFDGPDTMVGEGQRVLESFDLTLRHDNPEGAQEATGWFVHVAAENARITEFTTDDTVACDAVECPGVGLADEGFRHIVGFGNRAAVEFVLSGRDDVTIPAGSVHVIARITIEVRIRGTVTLSYVSGTPDETVIRQGTIDRIPTTATHEIAILGDIGPPPGPCFCDDDLAVAFSATTRRRLAAPVWTDALGVDLWDRAAPCSGGERCEAGWLFFDEWRTRGVGDRPGLREYHPAD